MGIQSVDPTGAHGDETDHGGSWLDRVYLPQLSALTWMGRTTGSGSGRQVLLRVGALDPSLVEYFAQQGNPEWACMPLGNLGLRELDQKGAAYRLKCAMDVVTRVRGRAVRLEGVAGTEDRAQSGPASGVANGVTRDVEKVVAKVAAKGVAKGGEHAVLILGIDGPSVASFAQVTGHPYALMAGEGGAAVLKDVRTGPIEPSYTNPEGRVVKLAITHHARQRMLLRWALLHQDVPAPLDVDWWIARLVGTATLRTKLTPEELRRVRRHGSDTSFLRNGELNFVVQAGTIVTVEIAHSQKRELNKVPPVAPTLATSADPERLRWRVSMVLRHEARSWQMIELGWFDWPIPAHLLGSSAVFIKFVHDALESRGRSVDDLLQVLVARTTRSAQHEVPIGSFRS